MVVKAELEKLSLQPLLVQLGEVHLKKEPTASQLKELDLRLRALGFELISSRKSRIIEQIKNTIVKLVHHSDGANQINLSALLTEKLPYDYAYLSNLFSQVEGTTIEKYFIAQKTEKVKELLIYDELSLSEIAFKLGYSSVAHLSAQFKKQTGLTPTFFKNMKDHKRQNIEDL